MSKKPKGVRGPKAEVLKLDMNWKDAVKKSFAKKRPKDGWPS